MPAFSMGSNVVLTSSVKVHKARSALGACWVSVKKGTQGRYLAVLVTARVRAVHSEHGGGHVPFSGAGDGDQERAGEGGLE